MMFVFPKDIALFQGALMNFTKRNNGYFEYSSIDISSPEKNVINLNGVEYVFTYLSDEVNGGSGGNSVIMRLFTIEDLYDDDDELDYQEPISVIKICKVPIKRKKLKKIHERFDMEVQSLKECLDAKFQNIVKIIENGVCKIFNPISDKYEEYPFYTMEYAQYSLKSFIESKHDDLGIDEKIGLCLSLCEGLNELESLGFYHRDIKPENIFMTESGSWKIGDLGLIDDRKKIVTLDRKNEAIGPRGWMTPESMNKYLCENKEFYFKHDCVIDHQSDIFQLGKVFWYIFQHNAPIGTVKESDFLLKNSSLFSVCKTMLNYSKKKRFKHVMEIIKLLKPIELKLLKSAS
ncbi:protein kinase family protein [Algoriphagus persicinus]|uniref:protein kinase family protein n=1 Tax=Algoriphagus persicinus TaxID=3108754 RepID=UPI002B3B51D1|nr:protein kinase family protein [Algoriphagus sp. E1-3-M2]MEB2786817.1 protein kinase family protein [Algoriphagus sp. E1-3-M2]